MSVQYQPDFESVLWLIYNFLCGGPLYMYDLAIQEIEDWLFLSIFIKLYLQSTLFLSPIFKYMIHTCNNMMKI